MASIFGGIEPPQWLQESTKVTRGGLGRVAGTALAGAVRGLTEKDEEGKPIGFMRGLSEARMTQADPLWPVKAKEYEARVEANRALAQSRWLAADIKSQEATNWADSVPAISEWMKGDVANTPIPEVTSPKAAEFARKVQQSAQANKIKADQVQNQLDAAQLREGIQRERNDLLRDQLQFRKAAPQSPIGKIESDRQRAIEAGMPPEVIAAYDAAIKKATTTTDTLYSTPPEIITVEGKKFLKYGKQLRDLSGLGPEAKKALDIAASKVEKAYGEWIKDTSNALARQAYEQALKEFEQFGKAPVTGPTGETSSGLPYTITPAP